MTSHAVDVARTAARARAKARAAATATRSTRWRSRLLRGQNAALRAKVAAAPGRTPTKAAYGSILAEMFASSKLMDDLWGAPHPRDGGAALHAARSAHRRILEQYAALGPSLPN